MKYNPIVLFAEKDGDKVSAVFMLYHLIIMLDISKKFRAVNIQKSAFGGEDVVLIRVEDETTFG